MCGQVSTKREAHDQRASGLEKIAAGEGSTLFIGREPGIRIATLTTRREALAIAVIPEQLTVVECARSPKGKHAISGNREPIRPYDFGHWNGFSPRLGAEEHDIG